MKFYPIKQQVEFGILIEKRVPGGGQFQDSDVQVSITLNENDLLNQSRTRRRKKQ